MNRLREYLMEYKKLTLSIIEAIEKEDYEIPEKILNEKQQVIDTINSLEYTKDEFINLSEELKLMSLEQKLNKISLDKRQKLKQRLNKSIENKERNKDYIRLQFSNYSILNKKI